MQRTSTRTSRLSLLLVVCGFGLVFLFTASAQKPSVPAQAAAKVLRGEGSFNDWAVEKPGNRHLIKAADLPAAYATESATNRSTVVSRPADAWPQVPEGFKADLFVPGLTNPRQIVTAPNGDLFLAESDPGRIRVLRGPTNDGKVENIQVFADGLALPYGIAFYPPGPNPQYVYVGNTNSVVRFPYQNGDLKARGPAETVVAKIPGGASFGGGHWTRNLVFSKDGKKLYVAVGSRANVADDAAETNRADILEFNPDGSGQRIYAAGIRNASGITMDQRTGKIWVAVNERDALGDDLVPDYVTHVDEGGFYGWPWFYMGPNQDPRFAGQHPEMKEKVLIPDVLLQSHSAPLSLAFYNGKQFPAEYNGGLFVTSHGSWNRAHRTGYKVIYVPAPNGAATGEYEDFVTGFVRDDGNVWGRPVGVTAARDGSLVFTDDGSGSVWRVSYVGSKSAASTR